MHKKAKPDIVNIGLSTKLLTIPSVQVVDYTFGSKYRRLLLDGNEPYLIEVFQTNSNQVEMRSLYPLARKISNTLSYQIERIFGLDLDILPFYSLMDKDPISSAIKNELYGLRPISSPNLFEALIVAITEQQISYSAALTIRRRLVHRYGVKLYYSGNEYYGFPSPVALSQANMNEIGLLGLTSRKAETISQVAKLIVSEELKLEDYLLFTPSQVIEGLCSIRGIGPWTAKYFAIKGLRKYEVVLSEDHALKIALQKAYTSGFNTSLQVDAFLRNFGDYAGLAALYFIYWNIFRKKGNQPGLFIT